MGPYTEPRSLVAMRIEDADDRHVPAIAAIYARAATTSAATFDLQGKPEWWWREAIADADPGVGHMTLVALSARDEVLGYAKSSRHKDRPAYDSTCETSAYLAEGVEGKGAGGALYDELLARLDASPLRLAVAGVAEPNEASTRLHVSRGFTRVGTFTGAGAKFGRAWDVTWYERPLEPPPLVAELRGVRNVAEAEAAIRAHGAFPEARVIAASGGGIHIRDPATGEQLAAIATGDPVMGGDRLLLEWCAEALARFF